MSILRLAMWVLLHWIVLALPAGCVTSEQVTPIVVSRHSTDGEPMTVLRGRVAEVRTTLADLAIARDMVRVIDEAEHTFAAMFTAAPRQTRVVGYLFSSRSQWDQFTRRRLGPRAWAYRRIRRGAYTHGDWFATWDQGRADTVGYAAHEAFHVLSATRLRSRPPALIEEGLAARFESARVEGERARIDLASNAGRQRRLENALTHGHLIPLSRLVEQDVATLLAAGSRTELFYAQAWALVRMLQDRYPDALTRLLADCVAGAGFVSQAEVLRDAGPVVEHYTLTPLSALETEYLLTIKRLATPTETDP